MTIKHDCEYYRVRRIERTRHHTKSTSSMNIHECYHRENNLKGGEPTNISKYCNTDNDFCPYNPKSNQFKED